MTDHEAVNRTHALLNFLIRQVRNEPAPALDWVRVALAISQLANTLAVDLPVRACTIEALQLEAKNRMAKQLAALRDDLREYARANAVRIWLFGSMARGDFRLGSDVDLAFDLRDGRIDTSVWNDLEDLCWRHRLVPDLTRLTWLKEESIERLLRGAEEIL